MGCAIQRTPFFTQLMDFTLRKNEKLRSRTAINRLFDEGKSLMAFPLRAAYRLREPGEQQSGQGVIPLYARGNAFFAAAGPAWATDVGSLSAGRSALYVKWYRDLYFAKRTMFRKTGTS